MDMLRMTPTSGGTTSSRQEKDLTATASNTTCTASNPTAVTATATTGSADTDTALDRGRGKATDSHNHDSHNELSFAATASISSAASSTHSTGSTHTTVLTEHDPDYRYHTATSIGTAAVAAAVGSAHAIMEAPPPPPPPPSFVAVPATTKDAEENESPVDYTAAITTATAAAAAAAVAANSTDQPEIEIKASTSDPQMNTMANGSHHRSPPPPAKHAPRHQRRSNSDIPLSVQTGAAFVPDTQQPRQYHPPLTFDPYIGARDHPNHIWGNQHQQQQQHHAQFLSWQAQQNQTTRSTVSSVRPHPSSSSGMNNTGTHMPSLNPPINMMPKSNMYNFQHFPPSSQMMSIPPPSSPRSLSHQPPPPQFNPSQPPPPPPPPSQPTQYYHPQQQQHFWYSNYPFHPSHQPMQYHPHQQEASHPIFYPYPPISSHTTKTGTVQQPQSRMQKSSFYGSVGNGIDSAAKMAPIFTSKPTATMDEHQPLLLSTSSSFDRRYDTDPTHQPPHLLKPTNYGIATTPHHPPRGQVQLQSDDADSHRNDTGRRHRRSLSSPTAGAFNYGALWSNNNINNNIEPNSNTESLSTSKRQLPTISINNSSGDMKSSNPQQFSPMAEFRKLQKGLSPKAGSSSSPAGRKRGTIIGESQPTSFRDNNNKLPLAPPSPTMSHHPRLHASLNDFNYHPSPQQQSHHHQQQQHHHHRTLSYNGDLGYSNAPPPLGARSLLLQRGESLRKMHARQKSAQLLVEDIKGIEQPLTCRNVSFLLLFVFHLVFMVYLGQEYGPSAFVYHGTNTDAVTIVYSNLVYIAIWSGLFAVGISALLLGAMTYFASHFVQIALFFMITLSFVWGTIGIGLSPKTTVPVTGIIALALAVAYTFIVWDRIPFASANLVTALTALRDFRGIIYVAFGFQFVALLYSVAYSILVFGIYDAMQDHGPLNLSKEMTYVVYILLVISFSWTLQVIQGTVQAITAAVVYKWWHEGQTEHNTTLVKESCLKTIFYSTGSICFGGLVVGPVRFLRWFFVLFRPSSTESSSLMCFHECVHYIQSFVSFCVDSLSAKCNSWAYTYIGMYHYGFLEAGGNATELFDKRGWSTIVSDDLVPNVLFLTSLVIGGITGCFAYLLSELDRLAVVIPKDEPGLAPFVEGVIIGLVLPSVVFCLISSSVNAVLVCFASSPMDFEIRHPTLSHDMRAAWRDVWPRALLVDDAVAIRLIEPNSPFLQPSYQGRQPSPF